MPFAVAGGGGTRLAYEFGVAGVGGHCPNPVAVRVLDADTGKEVGRFPVEWAHGANRIYVDLDLPEAPRRLAHRIVWESRGMPATETTGPPLDVRQASTLLRPPVAGGPWVAVYDPRLQRGHRRYVYSDGGDDDIPGRYAIDWFATAKDGSLHRGSGITLGQWHGFGAPVLAVEDALVVTVRDGYPDRTPRAALDDGPGTGNLIVLKLESGRHAFYEHLRQGSVRVRVGDQVAAGQVLAELGNSGHSMTPHLHFHLADGPSALHSEGVPYLLDGATSLGCYPSIEVALQGGRWGSCPDGTANPHRFPLPNEAVRFSGTSWPSE